MNNDFKDWAGNPLRFLETCDGGDPGEPHRKSIWVLGIEPGWSVWDKRRVWSKDSQSLNDVDNYSIELQLKWPFNRTAFKLLAALRGFDPASFREFASKVKPFEGKPSGYFKGNLFPVPAHSLKDWGAAEVEKTGFLDKKEYKSWLEENRFPILRHWIEQCRPKLIIAAGLSHTADFLKLVPEYELREETFQVNGYKKRVALAYNGVTAMAVVPHFSGGVNGLNSNSAVKSVAEIIQSFVRL